MPAPLKVCVRVILFVSILYLVPMIFQFTLETLCFRFFFSFAEGVNVGQILVFQPSDSLLTLFKVCLDLSHSTDTQETLVMKRPWHAQVEKFNKDVDKCFKNQVWDILARKRFKNDLMINNTGTQQAGSCRKQWKAHFHILGNVLLFSVQG